MSEKYKFERLYNEYLREYRPWEYYNRPAWSYYYRPWLYRPWRHTSYDNTSYDNTSYHGYDNTSYHGYRDKTSRLYDPYLDYLEYRRYYPSSRAYYDSSAIEEYVKTLEKLDNLRQERDSLAEKSCDLSSSRYKDDLHLSRSYRLAAEELEIEDLEDRILHSQIWSEGAPRPTLSAKETPYRSQINALRLKSLQLEEKRLLEVRRLQELERLRGPKPKWYELKNSQFHKEARKNNEILAAKKQWASLRDYTEDTWKSRDLTRSTSYLN